MEKSSDRIAMEMIHTLQRDSPISISTNCSSRYQIVFGGVDPEEVGN